MTLLALADYLVAERMFSLINPKIEQHPTRMTLGRDTETDKNINDSCGLPALPLELGGHYCGNLDRLQKSILWRTIQVLKSYGIAIF